AKSVGEIFGKGFVIFSPFVGVFGAFIAGSNTVSNLLFGAFQNDAAQTLGLPLLVILALQVVGGAIGNMIAIHNIIAANSTVGLKEKTGEIIRKTIFVALIYAFIVGFTAWLFFL
ncbi:MAG: L-lactate permease, partial [Nanoarchaeota archaeon]|nr:L-lactate permease [Nanoarchaeota archaeon]